MSETSEQAKTRRRWLTLAELVAVSGLLIGALTLWLNWSDKRDRARERAIASQKAAAAQTQLSLRIEFESNGDTVRLSDPRHELLETVIVFPRALDLSPESPAVARIERDWFAAAVLAATDGGADEREGRLPVLVTARFADGDAVREGSAIIEIVWRTKGHLVGGRSLEIETARVREQSGNAARIDALWAAELKRQMARA